MKLLKLNIFWMDIKTYSALQTVRYTLRAEGKNSVHYFERKDSSHDPVNTDLTKTMRGAYRLYSQEQEENREKMEEKKKELEIIDKRLASKRSAKDMMMSAAKKSRLAHVSAMKSTQRKRQKKV